MPRYSSHEVHMGDWLMAWAKEHHLAATRDRAGGNGNVIIEVSATEGMVPEGTPSIPWTVGEDVMTYLEEGTLSLKGDGTATLEVPASADKGFMILKTMGTTK